MSAAAVHDMPTIPHNLPTAPYDDFTQMHEEDVVDREEDEALTALENVAHEHRVLLSSDALRYFLGQVPSQAERQEVLVEVLQSAKVSFPSEEGWVVLSLARMEDLLEEVLHTRKQVPAAALVQDLEHTQAFMPMKASSLAEAIVAKNIAAAYALMSNRPMISLADAASDIDALYRERKGETVVVSDMLRAYTRELSTDRLESLALALTSALDGTYHTEEEAVKMAILKAVQVLK